MFFLLFVIFNVVATENSGNPVLKFEIEASHKCYANNLTVLEGEYITLHVKEFYKNRELIDKIRCRSIADKCQVLKTRAVYNSSHMIFPHVYPIMKCGKQWYCNLQSQHRNIDCEVNVHYRTRDPTGVMTLNDKDVNAKATNLSIDAYDSEANYEFEDGETVFIECQSSGYVMMRYHSAEKTISSEYVINRMRMLLKLTKGDHNSVIYCSYSDVHDTSVMRLHFTVQKPKSVIHLQINNMTIRPPRDRKLVYQHMYHEDEKTQVVCALRFHIDRYYVELGHNGDVIYSKEQSEVNHVLTLSRDHNNSKLRCVGMDKATKSTVVDKIEIQFVLSASDFYVTGLDYGGILLQYQNTGSSSVIHYEYTDHEKLTLNCTSIISQSFGPSTGMLFSIYGKSIETKLQKNKAGMYICHTFMLDASYSNKEILCLRYLDKASTNITIKLLYNTPAVPDKENNNNGGESGNNDVTTTESTHNNESEDRTERTNKNNENNDENTEITHWFWSVFGAVILIVMVIIICIALFCRYQRNKSHAYDTNYTNLLSSADNPLSMKRQENEPQYSNMIDIYPGNGELQYAEIMLKDNEVEFKKPDAPEYAQVMRNSVRENINAYENVGHGARYVNGNVREESNEPAYCELMLAHK